ncbi:PREDICTED: uncharacterized protein LOC105570667, partial [Vollenhovia emeryi]|uniref:uncharacterized protein LOC105570667 n=1 Tax=Vollenhovia emeryi TaxID=411798 RepID=UPI0005F3A4AD
KIENVADCRALAARTSGIHAVPYEVQIQIDINKEAGDRLINAKCECPAGESGKCKHAMATLIYLSRIEEDDMDNISCTDLQQQWGILKSNHSKEYEAKKLSEFCHVQKTSKKIEVTDEMKTKWREKLINYEETNLIKKLLCYRSWTVLGQLKALIDQYLCLCKSDVQKFYHEHVEISLERAVEIALAAQCKDKWISGRKIRITSSISYSLFTYASNKSPDWDKKYNQVFNSKFKGNANTSHGLKYEGPARDKYSNSLIDQKVIEIGLMVRPEVPWLGFSPDGIVVCSNNGNSERTIEIKCPIEGKRLSASEFISMGARKRFDHNGNLKYKHDHYGQIQLGLLLTGLDKCHYINYSSSTDDYICETVYFDELFSLKMSKTLLDVYFKEILPRIYAKENNNK